MRKDHIQIRVTSEEKREIKKRAEEFGVNMSEYILYHSLEKKVSGFVRGHQYVRWINDYLYELNKIGVNYNQMVRKYNSINKNISIERQEKLENDWNEYRKEMDQFMKKLIDLLLNFRSEEV